MVTRDDFSEDFKVLLDKYAELYAGAVDPAAELHWAVEMMNNVYFYRKAFPSDS
jgi:hypothetical protein